MLREILDVFEQVGPMSLAEMAKRTGIEKSALEGMIQFWVRKGKLREVCGTDCASCSIHGSCPLVFTMQRRYELVTHAEQSAPREAPRCGCHR